MAKTTVGAEVQVEYKSVGDMRKAIKEATGDVIRMQEQFGATSKEALAAAKRVTDLKDRIKDATEIADLFDPGNKFKALGNTVMVAANGFTALQGAMGLLGVESAEVEKQLLKVQSAMALTQSLSAIADSGKDFGRLAAMIKGPVVAAFTTLKGALMAVGIGLFTSAIALLVTNFDKIKAVIYETFPALEGLFENMDRIKQIAMGVGNAILKFVLTPAKTMIKIIQGDFSGAMEELKNGYNVVKNFREGEAKEIESQAQEKEAARQEELRKQAEHNKKILEQQAAAAERLRQQRQQAEMQYTQWLEQERERQLKLTMNSFEKELFEFRKKYDEQLAIAKKYGFDVSQLNALRLAEGLRIVNEETKENKKSLDIRLNDFKAFLPQQATLTSTLTANDVQHTKERVSWAELEHDQKVAFAQSIGNAMGALSELVGRQTAAGKALGIAQATINTWIGVTEILRQDSVLPSPFDYIAKAVNVAATVASGINAIRNIVKVQVPGGGGGAVPSLPSAAPVQAQLSTPAQAQLLNAQAINNMGNQAVQAYVLNSDIQNNNQVNAFLQRNASIG